MSRDLNLSDLTDLLHALYDWSSGKRSVVSNPKGQDSVLYCLDTADGTDVGADGLRPDADPVPYLQLRGELHGSGINVDQALRDCERLGWLTKYPYRRLLVGVWGLPDGRTVRVQVEGPEKVGLKDSDSVSLWAGDERVHTWPFRMVCACYHLTAEGLRRVLDASEDFEGAMKPRNSEQLLQRRSIDGALVTSFIATVRQYLNAEKTFQFRSYSLAMRAKNHVRPSEADGQELVDAQHETFVIGAEVRRIGRALAEHLEVCGQNSEPVLRVVYCADGGGGGPEYVGKLWPDIMPWLERLAIRSGLTTAVPNEDIGVKLHRVPGLARELENLADSVASEGDRAKCPEAAGRLICEAHRVGAFEHWRYGRLREYCNHAIEVASKKLYERPYPVLFALVLSWLDENEASFCRSSKRRSTDDVVADRIDAQALAADIRAVAQWLSAVASGSSTPESRSLAPIAGSGEAAVLMKKRFRVALSFPGEHRQFVRGVAGILSESLGRERVFYDEYYEAELARPNLDSYLQEIYHDQTDLNVVFLCDDYERKEWPGLEWRAIRDLIKKKQGDAIMLIRFDSAEITGIYSIDGHVSVNDRTPAQVARLIADRLNGRPNA